MFRCMILKISNKSKIIGLILGVMLLMISCRTSGISNIKHIAQLHSPVIWVEEVQIINIKIVNDLILITGKVNGKTILLRPIIEYLSNFNESKNYLIEVGKSYLLALAAPFPYTITPPINGPVLEKKEWPGKPYWATNIRGMYVRPIAEDNLKGIWR